MAMRGISTAFATRFEDQRRERDAQHRPRSPAATSGRRERRPDVDDGDGAQQPAQARRRDAHVRTEQAKSSCVHGAASPGRQARAQEQGCAAARTALAQPPPCVLAREPRQRRLHA
jgi:hypothetical protein